MPRPKTSKPWLRGLKPDEAKVARNFVMYSKCSGHFVPGGIDHIFAVLVMPDHWKLIEPCQIYCYEDEKSEVRKFGISNDHIKRANNQLKYGNSLYKNFLWKEDCFSRAEAISIEALLKKELVFNKLKETHEAAGDWVEGTEYIGGIWMNSIGLYSGSEITEKNGNEIKKMVLSYKKEWLNLSSEGFLRKYFADECNRFDEDVRKIISKEYKFTIENGNIFYKNKGLTDKANKKKRIPLENIPEIFYEKYNFSLIPDSFWS